MIDLMQIHPTGNDIARAIPVFIITKHGSDYTEDGIQYVKQSIKDNFGESRELAIITGLAVNSPKVLRGRLQARPESYVVLSTKNDIIFIPNHNNQTICNNIDERLATKPKATSWEILMETCKQELY